MNDNEGTAEPPSMAQVAEEFVLGHLQSVHKANAKVPLQHPDRRGVFGDSIADGMLHPEALIATVDANVLCNDLAYACTKKADRTTLITAANARAVRLYAAEHVINEVYNNGDRWCAERTIDPHQFWHRWENEYIQMLHVVPHEALSEDILAPAECERVQWIRERNDAKDIPSVILSLALSSFFLTEDRRAHYAVYGIERSYEELQRWRAFFSAGSSSSETAKLLFSGIAIPGIIGYAAFDAAAALTSVAPLVAVAAGIGLGILALRTPKETYAAIGAGLVKAGQFFGSMYQPYVRALEQFRKAEPQIPSWTELRGALSKRALLTRACIYTLGRSPRGVRSANQLADALPDLGVAQSTRYVRDVLRGNSAFLECERGRWQLGHYYDLWRE